MYVLGCLAGSTSPHHPELRLYMGGLQTVQTWTPGLYPIASLNQDPRPQDSQLLESTLDSMTLDSTAMMGALDS